MPRALPAAAQACAAAALLALAPLSCSPASEPETQDEARAPARPAEPPALEDAAGRPAAEAAPAPARRGAPTFEEAAGLSYGGLGPDPIALRDGSWEGEADAPGAAARLRVGLVEDFRVTGDLDGDGEDESVFLLWRSAGGSGSEGYVAAVDRRADGSLDTATALLGDRVQVRRAEVAGGRLRVHVLQAGPGDALCCPGELATRSFELAGGALRELATDAAPERLSLAALTGPQWVLTHLDLGERAPHDPEVSIRFLGTRIAGSGGCNRYSGGLAPGETPGEVTLAGPLAVTRMACPEGPTELEAGYLERLERLRGYGFLAGRLVLEFEREDGAAGAMLFARRAADPAG